MTLEEVYQADVRAINAAHPKGSPERELLRRRRFEKFQADDFERSGNPAIVWTLQRRFAVTNLQAIQSVYSGEIDAEEYRRRKIASGEKYARRLFELGLVDQVFGDDWIRDFVKQALTFEREIVPLKTTGLTDAELLSLCEPLRDLSKTFLEDVHRAFGRARLKSFPRIVGGVDDTECAEEERALREGAARATP